jgi:hypothetical protein
MDKSTQEYAEKTLSCPICFNIYEDPVILDCCGNTFCKKCMISMKSICPYCAKQTGFRNNLTVENFLENLPVKCECGKYYYRKEKENHLNECSVIKRKCKYCNFVGNRQERSMHGLSEHEQVLIDKYIVFKE